MATKKKAAKKAAPRKKRPRNPLEEIARFTPGNNNDHVQVAQRSSEARSPFKRKRTL